MERLSINVDSFLICKYIFKTSRFPYAVGDAFFGEGNGRVWLDEVNCNGTETDIYECESRGWGETNCGHSKDVSVFCGSVAYMF